MSANSPGDVVPKVGGSGSARASRIPRGPPTRSQANTATDPEVQESPTGIEAYKDILEGSLRKMSGEIRQEVKKILEPELALVQKQLELQKSDFHTALVELTALVDLVEKERGGATNGLEPEVIASLKLSVNETRRDANQALESLGKFRTSIDDRFDRAAHHLKYLEQAACQKPQEPNQEPLSTVREGNCRSKRNKAARQRSLKSKTSRKDKRRRSKSHCSDNREDRDSMSETNSFSEDGNDGSSNRSGDSEHRSEEVHGISRRRKVSSRRVGVTPSASRRD